MHAESTSGSEPESVKPEIQPSVEPAVLTSRICPAAIDPGEIKKAEHWLIWIGIFSILVNMVIAAFYYRQLKEMVKATDASTKAANAATDSVGVARDTLDASKKAMGLDQRAWLGLSEPNIVITDEGYLQQKGFAINSGKTPARDVHAVMGVYAHWNMASPYKLNEKDYRWIRYILKRAWNNEIKQTDYLAAPSREITPPYRGLLPPLTNWRDWVGAPQLKSMGVIPPGNSPYTIPLPKVSGSPIFTFIIYGEIRYTDFVGQERRITQFCYVGVPQAEFSLCDKLNDMN